MGRLEELRINAYLSEVARGYRNNAFVAQYLFPEIPTEKEKTDIFEFNKEAFNIYDTERAIRAESNIISPQGFTKHTTTLTEHDLSYPIDDREEQEAEKVKLQLHATNVVTEGLKLKHEKQCADLVQDVDNYPDENKIILSSTSCFNWSASDPQGVIDDGKDQVSAKIAQDPNTMVIGQSAWKLLKKHPQLKGLLSDNLNKLVTVELLKEIFEIENVFIGKSIYADKDGNYCAEGAKALGVSDVSVESGEYVPVGIFGILVVLSGGTITSGSAVTSSDEGKAVTADDTTEINGYALEDVSEGEEVRIIRGI